MQAQSASGFVSRVLSLSFSTRICFAIAFLLLAACGGGGGSPADRSPTTESPTSETPTTSETPATETPTTETPGPTTETPAPTGTLSGFVFSQAGVPLAGATVRAGGITATTAADGGYTLAAVAANERTVAQITLDGYAESFVVEPVLANQTQEARVARLLPVGETVAIDPAVGGTVSVPSSTAQVVLPSGGLVLENGGTPAGNVSVSLTNINPAKDTALMPGDFTAIPSASTLPVTIESFGALQVSARDANGQSFNLAPGSTAKIRIPLGTRSDSPPASVPLYWFNAATGRWQEDGSATLDSGAQVYQGTVTRLGNWNAGQPMQIIYASGCVEDGQKQPVGNVRVVSDGVNYSSSASTHTAVDGTFRVEMRHDGEATLRAVNGSGKTLGTVRTVGPSVADIDVKVCLNIDVAPLEIAPTVLPLGKVDTAYNATLAATGGTPAYTWSLSSGTLPGGLNFDFTSGLISGTPSVEGASVFTAQVQDSSNPQQSANRSLEIRVQAADAPPTVATTSPANNDIGVGLNSVISATFSEALDASTVTANSFIVRQGNSATDIIGTVGYSGTTATFTPSAQLTANTLYTATLTTGITNVAGKALAANYEWRFTTEAAGTVAKWRMVSAGDFHTMAIKTDGTLWAWGDNNFGRLGDPNIKSTISKPIKIGFATDWKLVYAGQYHTVAIKTDGSLWAWGSNRSGQLGLNDAKITSLSEPTKIGTDTDWISASAGSGPTSGIIPESGYTIALKSSGSLWAWGNNTYGQLGLGNTENISSPTPIDNTDLTSVWAFASTGQGHTVSVKTDGSLWAWGSNGSGQIGRDYNATSPFNIQKPIRVDSDIDWFSVSAGRAAPIAGQLLNSHTVAIKKDGSLWAWGFNGSGQLGDGTDKIKSSPTLITGANASDKSTWVSVATGLADTIGIKTDGSLWAWGWNSYGQLGIGDGTKPTSAPSPLSAPKPTQIGIDTDWFSVSAGTYHTLAIKSDGSLWAWGWNLYGQLGDRTTVNKSAPVRID